MVRDVFFEGAWHPTVFFRDVWLPSVFELDDRLLLHVLDGAGSNHDPRDFTVAIREEHLHALQDSLRRHILLLGPLSPLCYQAGDRRDWDGEEAARLTDAVLLAEPAEVDRTLREVEIDRWVLIAHHGSIPLLDEHRYYEAMASPSLTWDVDLMRSLGLR